MVLLGTIIDSSDIWLVENGASRHMTTSQDSIKDFIDKDSTLQVELGNNSMYGVGITTLQLESKYSLHMKDVLFVLGLNKNLLSI